MAGEGGVPPFGPESCLLFVPLLPKGGSGPTAEGVPRSQFSFRLQAKFFGFFWPIKCPKAKFFADFKSQIFGPVLCVGSKISPRTTLLCRGGGIPPPPTDGPLPLY